MNKPYGDCQLYIADASELQTCECDPNCEEPCGESSDCINRVLFFECPITCQGAKRCQNQRFQRRSYPKLRVKRTALRGWGLELEQDITRGTFIIEYAGELITMAEFHSRIEKSRQRKELPNFYYMTVDSNRMVDAGPKGNLSRFMNHSCDPNCYTQKWSVNGDTRIGLFALEDIRKGAELTFNYQFEVVGDVKQKCHCRAKNCPGFIGEKPIKSSPDRKLDKSSKRDKGKRRKGSKQALGDEKVKKNKNGHKSRSYLADTKTWEELCFRCFEDGELLMCDWKECPKVYHLACLGREKMPLVEWFCPWHHCVTCGKSATSFCVHCPNAYCLKHDVIFEHPKLGKLCDEHKEDINDLIIFYQNMEDGCSNLSKPPRPPKKGEEITGQESNVEMNQKNTDEGLTFNSKNSSIQQLPNLAYLDNSHNDSSISDNPSSVENDIERDDEIDIDIKDKAKKNLFGDNCCDLAMSENIPFPLNTKKKIKKIPCGELNCGWTGKKGVLVQHYEKTHEYSTENSEMLSRLAFELAIRRRQGAASKARRLSLEIQIAQLSRSPKKSIEAIERKDHCQFISSQTNSKTSLITTVQSSNHRIPTSASSEDEENVFDMSKGRTELPPPPKKEILSPCPICECLFSTFLLTKHLKNCHPGEIHKENIVKVGPEIDQTTGKASLKAKKMVDPQDEEAQIDNEVKEVKNNLPLAGIAPLNETISSPSVQNDPSVENCPVQKDSPDRNTSIESINRSSPSFTRKSLCGTVKKQSISARNEIVISPKKVLGSKRCPYVHSSNTARHWRSQHPHLDYSPRKFSHNQSKFQDDDNFEDSNCETPKSISSNLWPTRMESNDNQTEDLNSSNVGSNKTSNLITRSSKRIKETFTLITSGNNKENSITDKQQHSHRTRSRR